GPPPCEVPAPTLDFMREDTRPFSASNMTSAAWFARQVQLTEAARNAAWQSMAVPPVRVTDFSLERWGLHATLLEFDSQVLVLYRGTEDVLDYLLNATFYTSRHGETLGLPGWVHEGFYINFLLSWQRVSAAVREAAGRGKSVVLAGHSLGGVLSQYAAWLLENEGIRVVRVYAFQAPNPGDLEFKTKFEERFDRRHSNTVYGVDVTTHIPPVLEAAEVFGDASIQPVGKVMTQLLTRARYGALGERFSMSADGVRTRIENSSIPEFEQAYWKSYRQVSGGKAFPLGLAADSPLIADHDIDRVLCALAKSKSSE
ncbi:MAG: hypothetical protein RIR26_533, partial [Pseudomonadota bacterium]